MFVNRSFNSLAVLLLLVFGRSTLANDAPYWNQFRGPLGDGTSDAQNLPIQFSETDNVRWKTRIEGSGWSSPVVWGNEVWLTTGIESGKELLAIGLSLADGQVIHRVKVFEAVETPVVESYRYRSAHLNSPASPTPVIEEGRLFVSFGTQGVACVDTQDGEVKWERRDLHCDHVVGPGSSPIVDDECMYIAFDGIDQQYFVALDKESGETRWQQDRNVVTDWASTLEGRGIDPKEAVDEKPGDNKKSYATALIIEHEGRRQLVAPAAEAIIAYDPANGDELWRVNCPGGFNVACRPIYANGLVYVSTGGLITQLMAIRPDGEGDVTHSHIEWSTQRSAPSIPSPIIADELMFTVTDRGGIACCIDATTGDEVWRARLGGEYWSSPLLAHQHIYFFNKSGDIHVLGASRELNQIAESQLSGSFIASPAVVDESILARSTSHLYCLQNGFEREARLVEEEQATMIAQQQETVDANERSSEELPTFEEIGDHLKALVIGEKLSKNEAIELWQIVESLKAEVERGELSLEDALAKYREEGGLFPESRQMTEGEVDPESVFEELGNFLKIIVDAGKMPEADAIEYWQMAEALKAQVEAGELTLDEALEQYKEAGGPVRDTKPTGRTGFYAIVIGRLVDKDVELGEFSLEVDYVTSMYDNRWVSEEIIGKTISVSGVTGPFLDQLFLIEPGETLKFRSGNYDAELSSLTFGSKFHVLERALPFNADDYGVPPETFRGFQGVLLGQIVEMGGFEALIRIEEVLETSPRSTADDAQSIVGKLVRVTGFYEYEETYNDLQIDDSIRFGVTHVNPSFDEFGVSGEPEKVER